MKPGTSQIGIYENRLKAVLGRRLSRSGAR
jgi:hypothetical protein